MPLSAQSVCKRGAFKLESGSSCTNPVSGEGPAIRSIGNLDQDRPFVDVKIGKTGKQALVDTGADICVVSEEFYKVLISQNSLTRAEQSGPRIKCTSASGNEFRNRGEIRLKFEIGRVAYSHPFQILQGLTKPIIIGSDFLQKQKAVIDFHEYTIRMNGQVVQMMKDDERDEEVFLLKTCHKVPLPS